MIKNRVFMLGLGIGLIIGAVLLQLMIMGERSMSTEQPQDKQWTKEQLEEGAKALGVKVVDDSDELMSEEQWKEKMKTESEKMTGTPAVPPSKPAESEQPDSPQTPVKPDKTKNNTTSPDIKKPSAPKEAAPAQIRFVIADGNNLSHVADGLKKAGVITDKQAFIKEATAKRINTHIQTGTYTFTAGESAQSIIHKISAKPSGNPK